jgi:hypothetical protein
MNALCLDMYDPTGVMPKADAPGPREFARIDYEWWFVWSPDDKLTSTDIDTKQPTCTSTSRRRAGHHPNLMTSSMPTRAMIRR